MSDLEKFWETRAIYLVRSGSHAYGTNTPTSDVDTRGVCIPPDEYILGLREWEQFEDKERDTTIYSLHKFVRLALNCNPNIVELLHVRDEDILNTTESGRYLRDHRSLFVTKRAFKTFGGYAYAQLQMIQKGKTAKHGSHVGLVEQFGYDTKNAMHLIRILRMGCEILQSGLVQTFRPDHEELLSIRQGAWTMEQVLQETERLNERLKLAVETSPLPDEPPFDTINRMVMYLTRRALEERL
jgi:predicted nucleotidyltransferase